MEVDKDNMVYIDKNDICVYCENRYGCPLIECLGAGLVEATEPISVKECEHFKLFGVSNN